MAKNKTTIASGGTDSAAIDLNRRTLVGLIMPAAFDGTVIKFKAYREVAGDYVIVKDSAGNDVSVTVGTDRHVVIAQTSLYGVTLLKLSAGTSQSADRVIELVVR